MWKIFWKTTVSTLLNATLTISKSEGKNRLNRENWKKIIEKPNREKKLIKILKKPTGSVRFYKPETEKTELNPNRKKNPKKLSQTGKNRAKTKQNRKNRAKPVWTGFGSVLFFFFFLNQFGYFFFIITKSNKK